MVFTCTVLCLLAVGEPPQCLSCGILLALKRAIESARKEIGDEAFFLLCKLISSSNITLAELCFITISAAPATTDVRQQMCLVDPQQFYF